MGWDILLSLLCVGMTLFFAFKVYRVRSAGFRKQYSVIAKEVEQLEETKLKLEVKITEAGAALDDLKGKMENVAQTRIARDEKRLMSDKKKKTSKRSIALHLKESGLITEQQLEKARKYQESVQNDMPVEEVLLMFGFTTPEMIKQAANEIRGAE